MYAHTRFELHIHIMRLHERNIEIQLPLVFLAIDVYEALERIRTSM
jgi:hypothetical protein